MNLVLKPEEIEPISNYNILTNDANEVLIVIPGFFRGKAREAKLLYNGGDHAILVRNRHQILLCDAVHPDVRKTIMENDKVLIFEEASIYEYNAKVVRFDTDECAKEALRIHKVSFSHYRFPVINQDLDTGDEICSACGAKTKIFLRAKDNNGNDTVICPGCIANKMAFKCGYWKLPDYPEQVLDYDPDLDVLATNPPIKSRGKNINLWGVHCDTPGIYLGEATLADINVRARAEYGKNIDNPINMCRINKSDWVNILTDNSYSCHMFKCPKCEGLYNIFYKH